MTFNFVASITVGSSAISLTLAALFFRLARNPGWEEQRPFAWALLTAGLGTAANVSATLPFPEPLAVLLARLQVLAIGLHLAVWHHFHARSLRRRSTGLDRALIGTAVLGAALAAVPGVVFDGRTASHEVRWLGLTYFDVVPTPFGEGAMVFFAVSAAVAMLRVGQAWREGVPRAGTPLLALAGMIAAGTHDALVTAGALDMPYLLDLGFLAPLAAVSYASLDRFARDSRALGDLRTELERKVEIRSRELAAAQESLLRAEKLASLGQLAAGVAHEINNPASAVVANLGYAERTLAACDVPGDVREALHESREAVERITRTVRELLDAGRAAVARPEERVPVRVAEAAAAAVQGARARFGFRARIEDHTPRSLYALGQIRPLTHMLGHLLANAIQALGEDNPEGRVVIRGERDGTRVRLVVEDDGPGIPPEVLRRLFEPYFSTKTIDRGMGLGLAVSRGLVTSLGGDLRLESTPGRGTRAVIELEAAPPPAAPPDPRIDTPAPSPLRCRVLVLDDEGDR